jgi:hypothetical protein
LVAFQNGRTNKHRSGNGFRSRTTRPARAKHARMQNIVGLLAQRGAEPRSARDLRDARLVRPFARGGDLSHESDERRTGCDMRHQLNGAKPSSIVCGKAEPPRSERRNHRAPEPLVIIRGVPGGLWTRPIGGPTHQVFTLIRLTWTRGGKTDTRGQETKELAMEATRSVAGNTRAVRIF